MIDLDRLEQRLELSLTEDLRLYRTGRTGAAERAPRPAPEPRSRPRFEPPPAPAPPAAPQPSPVPLEAPPAAHQLDLDRSGHLERVVVLLAHADRDGADHDIAAHARLVAERGSAAERADAAALAAMVALLDGRQSEARAASDRVRALAREAGDPQATDRYWSQRLWIVLEWGDGEEYGDLLDYCRDRAYRYEDSSWLSATSLLLARVGGVDESRAAFDAASRALDESPGSGPWLDQATDLAEAAALLGDPRRAGIVSRALTRARVPAVVVGRGWVCKGATARYRGLLAAAMGRWDDADREYRAANEVQRRLEAGPLLARTLHEWGRALQGRDDLRSRAYLQEGAELGRQLALADFLPLRSGTQSAPSGERAS